MILEKKTALLSPRGAHGVSGVARFECFKEKSDVRISLSGAVRDAYAVVAVGDELRAVRPCSDRVYLARTDLSGDCAVIVADAEKRVLCAGATTCGYDFSPLEKFMAEAYGSESVAAEVEQKSAEESGGVEEMKKEEPAAEEGGEKPSGAQEAPAEQTAEKETAAESKDNEKPAEEKKRAGRFYDRIAEKLSRLLGDNEREEELCALIPDSRWARVKAEDGAYVVGVVGDPVEFICYGIPAESPADPPDEKQGCRQWLEVVKGGRGYWMMYQSAETGETLTADVI